jgi:hypothetical protein
VLPRRSKLWQHSTKGTKQTFKGHRKIYLKILLDLSKDRAKVLVNLAEIFSKKFATLLKYHMQNDLSNETICRPPQSHETIPLKDLYSVKPY